MNDLNLKTITVAIMSNKKNTSTNVNYKCNYIVYLEPIKITLSTFKHSFFPYNHYSPNEFLEITNFNYYNVLKRINNNDISTLVQSCDTEVDSCDIEVDSCDK